MKPLLRLSTLKETALSGQLEPDYFKPLPPTPTARSVLTTPNQQPPEKLRLRSTVSVSAWKAPEDWAKNTELLTNSPPPNSNLRAYNYSLLVPEPSSNSTNAWMEPASCQQGPTSVPKTFLEPPQERPLSVVPEVPRRNPSRLSLREDPFRKNSPKANRSTHSSYHSDVSFFEGLSKATSKISSEESNDNPTVHPLSPCRNLRSHQNEEHQNVFENATQQTSSSRQMTQSCDNVSIPETEDTVLVPRPLSWRKSSGNLNVEHHCTCHQSPPPEIQRHKKFLGKLKSWAFRKPYKSKQPKENSQNRPSVQASSTRRPDAESSPIQGPRLLSGHIFQYGKDFWLHIKQASFIGSDKKGLSICPVHPNESLAVYNHPDPRANMLFCLPGGFALVRQSPRSKQVRKSGSVNEFPVESYPYEGLYMHSQAPVLELPALRASYCSEVTATSTRAIHNCSRLSLGSNRAPESGSNLHLSLPSPLAHEILFPGAGASPALQYQALYSSSSSVAVAAKTAAKTKAESDQRADSLAGKNSPKLKFFQSAKGAWNSWKSR